MESSTMPPLSVTVTRSPQHNTSYHCGTPLATAATACPGRPRIVSCRGARLEWSGGDNIFHKRCDGLMVGWHVKQWWVWARLGCKMLLAAEMSIRRDMYHGQVDE